MIDLDLFQKRHLELDREHPSHLLGGESTRLQEKIADALVVAFDLLRLQRGIDVVDVGKAHGDGNLAERTPGE
ncbi:MAG: hypothetical protein AAGK78_16895, partial [Planctomycetota bacterium]